MTEQRKRKAKVTWEGWASDTGPRYLSGYNFLSEKSLNPLSGGAIADAKVRQAEAGKVRQA